MVGLNCGTSVDAVDVAVVRIRTLITDIAAKKIDLLVKLLSYCEVQMDRDLRNSVLMACRPGTSIPMADVSDMNFAIAEVFGEAVKKCNIDLSKVDVIASHGQTVWHEPRGKIRNSTLQLGDPSVISQITDKTVVSGFRSAEVAVGRQGAPICGFLEALILKRTDLVRVSQNIGGIGNVTVADPELEFFQFDTGPGNMLIDAAVRILTEGKQDFDKDGALGKKGESYIDDAFVKEFLDGEYFKLAPPKTTGRELFGDDVAESIVKTLQDRGLNNEAIIATITRITTESIARAYEEYVIPSTSTGKIDEIYLCGGGAHNKNIVEHLKYRFPDSVVAKIDQVSPISADAKEAVAFAILGYLTINGIALPVPRFSESDKNLILGSITPGNNFNKLFHKIESHDDDELYVLRYICVDE